MFDVIPLSRIRVCPRALLLALCLLLAFEVIAQTTRERQSFNADWRFQKGDPTEAGDQLRYAQIKDQLLLIGNEFKKAPGTNQALRSDLGSQVSYTQPGFNDSDWRKLDLPHDWGIESPFKQEYPGETGKLEWWGVGWYRKHFTLPAGDKGKQIFLDLDGAMAYATVWLNGQFIGGWPYGYSSFRLELTPHLKFGADNVLAIRLDNPPDSSRWYPGGGIYRNVWLVKTAPVHVKKWGTLATAKVQAGQATVALRTEIENQSKSAANVRVISTILDPAGKQVGKTASSPSSVAEFEAQTYEQQVIVKQPSLWSLEERNLYRLVTEVEADTRYQIKVIGWLRNKRRLRAPYDEEMLLAGDVLLIRTRPEDLVAIRQEPGVELHPIVKHGAETTPTTGGDEEELADVLVQAVVAPGSDQVGRTIGEIDFRQRYGVVVLSLWRKAGWFNQELAKTRLRPGDVLVLQGDEEALARVEHDRAFLMLVPFHGELRLRRKAGWAGFIMLATIVATATNLIELEIAALTGAAAIVLTRCLTMRQAYRAIDTRIYVFIAGALPLGAAMQKTGTAALLANWLSTGVRNWNQTVILLVLFALAAALTQLMSDSATTALLAPVAVALAQTLGYPPEAFVVTVAMAAVASFLTPIGHHGNLLIYGPGGYQFSDFIRVGTPLTILIALIVVVLAPMIFQ